MTDELMALLAKATAMNGETFAQTIDRIIYEHSAWIGCPNKQVAEKIAFSALVRASVIAERAESEEVTLLIAEVERLREALAFKAESAAFEAWAERRKMDMNQHPLHYLFTDKKTDLARDAWRDAVSYARAALESPKP